MSQPTSSQSFNVPEAIQSAGAQKVTTWFPDLVLPGDNHMDMNMLMSNDVEPQEPTFFPGNALGRIAVDVTVRGTQVAVSTLANNVCHDSIKGMRMIKEFNSQEVKNIRHDIVASMLSGKSDVPLSVMDDDFSEDNRMPYHAMTPDFYSEITKNVGELATTQSQNLESIKRDFDRKMNKYRYYLKQIGITNFFVFVVSTSGVYTNYPMDQGMVNLLVTRLMLGLLCESKIVDAVGQNVFSSKDEDETLTLVENVLKSIKYKHIRPTPDLSVELMTELTSPMDEESKKSAIALLGRTWDDTNHKNITHPSAYEAWEDKVKNASNGCREDDDLKRVSSFPIVSPKELPRKFSTEQFLEYGNILESDAPISIREVWVDMLQNGVANREALFVMDQDLKADIGVNEYLKHQNKMWRKHTCKLSDDAKIEMALSGIHGKRMRNDGKLKEKDEKSHLSFSPTANTKDIDDFIHGDALTGYVSGTPERTSLSKLLSFSKNMSHRADEQTSEKSTQIFRKYMLPYKLVQFADLMCTLLTEVAIANKHYNKDYEFHYRYCQTRPAAVITHNTGSHIFCSFAFEKKYHDLADTGRIGPKMFELGDLYVSDWCSFERNKLQHLLKAGPYMSAILARVISSFELDIFDGKMKDYLSEGSNSVHSTMKSILLLYLNNKIDVEELITAQRYLVMNVMDPVCPDPYRFVKRLPDVLRSRLTSYYVQRSRELMSYYWQNKIKMRIPRDGGLPEYDNIKTVFDRNPVPLERAIDSFYYSYVISKDRQTGVHNNYKICKKLLKEEFVHLENVNGGKELWCDIEVETMHRRNKHLFKYIMEHLDNKMGLMLSDDHRLVSKKRILEEFSRASFSQVATLKVSSRHKENTDHDLEKLARTLAKEGKQHDFSTTSKKLRDMFPDLYSRRPRALEKITETAERFEKEKGRSLKHIIELVPEAIERLHAKDGFDSDLFPKSQHGGHREIHVLEMDARLLQFFCELISRVLCSYFESETITHPKLKEHFVPKHYKEARMMLSEKGLLGGVDVENFVTLGKAADAKTWCQNHHVSGFCAMLMKLTDPLFHGLIYNTMYLWTRKRVTLPSDFVASLISFKQGTSGEKEEIRNRKLLRCKFGKRDSLKAVSNSPRLVHRSLEYFVR